MSTEEEFLVFWFHYPRKIGKKAAMQAWKKATDKPPLVDLLKAIENAKKTEQWRKDNGVFIPHPSTWLNQGRWDDVLEIEVEPPKPVLVGPKAYHASPKLEGEFVPMPDGWLQSVMGKIAKSMP